MSTEHIPGYLAGADSDPLMIAMAVVLVISILVAGVLYFKLHAVPEHIAHGKNHTQMQLIAILTILALFTHNNIFWIAALVLAVVEFPDFLSPLKSIAKSLETIAKAKNSDAEAAPEEKVVKQHMNKENN
jgi:phosphatidylglycerophosphate synthase